MATRWRQGGYLAYTFSLVASRFMLLRSREATEARFSEPVAGSFGGELCEQRSEAELGKGGLGGNPVGGHGSADDGEA